VKNLSPPDWRLPLLGSMLLLLTLGGAVWVDHFDDPNIGYFLLLQALLYAIAAWVSLRAGEPANSRTALITILLVAAAMRLVLLPEPPVSTDLYRYLWDGRVQGAGVNPYVYVPADPVLASLRDETVYPLLNRADYARSIYPLHRSSFSICSPGSRKSRLR
jgi:alpha-1,6-mannosyltransferase